MWAVAAGSRSATSSNRALAQIMVGVVAYKIRATLGR
jgi:hypothetical protein